MYEKAAVRCGGAVCAYLKVLSVEHPGPILELDRYVWRSALNLAPDWLRRQAVPMEYARYRLVERARRGPPAESRELEARECMEVLAHVFESVSTRCQGAYLQRVRQKRPFNAVGQAMGMSDRMVKIYVARAGPSMRVSAGP